VDDIPFNTKQYDIIPLQNPTRPAVSRGGLEWGGGGGVPKSLEE